MVKSILVPDLSYPVNKSLREQDVLYEAQLYEIPIQSEYQLIALGKPSYEYAEKSVVNFPIYKVDGDLVSECIGVYEIMSNNEVNVIDEEGDIDISLLGEPLFYSNDSQVTSTDTNLVTAEEKVDNIARSGFRAAKGSSWIVRLLKDKNYSTLDNEGGGDCLFAAIRDGLATVGVNVTVGEMREMLAAEASEEVYNGYKTMYNLTNDELAKVDKDVSFAKNKHAALLKQGRSAKSNEDLTSVIVQGREAEKMYRRAMTERKNAKLLVEEYKIMKDIGSLEEFKVAIKSCSFWGDTWAISTLERVLNVKLILLSKNAYAERDLDNVLTCGQMNDTILSEKGVFQPSYYIILEYTGMHYMLVTYKGLGALTYKEIPENLKDMIVSKCLEKGSGLFSLIPEFASNEKPAPIKKRPDTVLQFHSRAALKPNPGRGTGERIRDSERPRYNKLKSIPEWRRMLSLEYPTEFHADGLKWASGQHYYSALHFKEDNPQFYMSLSLDKNPEGDAAKDPALAKAAIGLSGKSGKKIVRPSAIKIDKSYHPDKKDSFLDLVNRSKFTDNPELKKTLLATNEATLNEYVRGKPPIRSESLMRIREELSSKK